MVYLIIPSELGRMLSLYTLNNQVFSHCSMNAHQLGFVFVDDCLLSTIVNHHLSTTFGIIYFELVTSIEDK